jgi:cytochrome c biogenesis protein CcmG/thiol:disulfide interchange protein DsbE|tara:strand:+ start:550 stop:1095 length:546 start_codon:yes stop_codon:yes gene_type:complete
MKNKRISPLIILPPLIFLGLATLFILGIKRENPNNLPSVFINKSAPAITDMPLEGYNPVSLEEIKSPNIKLVNFWASWCPPCRAEHPKLLELSEQGVQIIGVNFNDNKDNANSYLQESGNPFTSIAFDPSGKTAIDWGVTAPPETFILNNDGVVIFRFAGPLVGSDYENRFEPALRDALQE